MKAAGLFVRLFFILSKNIYLYFICYKDIYTDKYKTKTKNKLNSDTELVFS